MIPLFDLHCDTFSKLYKNKCDLYSSDLHISLNKSMNFFPYIQVGAIWSDSNLSNDDAYINYRAILNYVRKINSIEFLKNYGNFSSPAFILAIEDARLLNNDLNRVEQIYKDGVKVLTLNWKDESCIGGGWNTNSSLSDFGILVVKRCCELGIIIDLSHSSYEVQTQVLNISQKPVIYSHSNSFSVCPHKRNLRDDLFKELVKSGGVVGISMYAPHLTTNKCATAYDVIKHIEHFLKLGGENNVCLGCDFDGISVLPETISSIRDLKNLFTLISSKFSVAIARKIFYQNAYNFFQNTFKRR